MGEQYRYYVKSMTVTDYVDHDDAESLTSSSRAETISDSQTLSCSDEQTAELSHISEDSTSNNTSTRTDSQSHLGGDTEPTFWRPHDEVSQFCLLRSKDAYSKDGDFKYTKEWPKERIKAERIQYKYRLAREIEINRLQKSALKEELIDLDGKIQRVRNQIAEELKERQILKMYKKDLKRLYKSLKAAKRRAKRERTSK